MYQLSHKRNSKSLRQGVVMLDVVAGLAVVALATFVLMPRPRSSIGGAELLAEAVRISGEFRKGRVKAISTGGVVDVAVDARNHRIQVDGANPVAVREEVALDWITSDQCPMRGGYRALRFLADGRSCGGVMTLSASGQAIELRVDWLTGRSEMGPK